MAEDVAKVTKQYQDRIKEKEAQFLSIGNKLRNELAKLKKLHGPDRKIKKSDACFADYKEY